MPGEAMISASWTRAQLRFTLMRPMTRLTADQRRTAIVDAAITVARRKGLASTTVRDVAQVMDSSSGLVHHYFETMDDVLAAAFERVAGDDLRSTAEAVAAAPDPISAMQAILRSYEPVDADWAFQLWLDAWAEAARRPALRVTSRRLNLAWQALLERTIRAGVAVGQFRCSEPAAAAWRIISVLDGLGLQIVAHGTIIERSDVLAWAASSAEHELGLRPGALVATA